MPMFVCFWQILSFGFNGMKWNKINLMPSRQKENHIFTKDLKMNPPTSTSQVKLVFNSTKSSLTSLLLDRLHIFSRNIWLTFQRLNSSKASPTRPKYIQVSMFFSTLQGNFKHFSNKIVEFVSDLALHMWIIPAWS